MYLSCIFFVKKQKYNINRKTLCIFVFFIFPLLPKMHFVFFLYFLNSFTDCTLSFCIFSLFRHAVEEKKRESTNVCCISLLLLILPPSVLYFFCNLGLHFFSRKPAARLGEVIFANKVS